MGAGPARSAPKLEAVTAALYSTMVTFGRWDDLLREPLPPPELRFTTAMAYYGRGAAFAAKGRWAEAGASLDTVAAAATAFPAGDHRIALEIAAHALAGQSALRRGLPAAAVDHFRSAADLEDRLTDRHPPTWYYPARPSLGKALLAAGRPAEAERVYREDLARFPENGWSPFGLAQALAAQGRAEDAAEVGRGFHAAWRAADVELVASRF